MTIKSKILSSVIYWLLGLSFLLLFMANFDLILRALFSVFDTFFRQGFEFLNYFRFE